MKKDKSGLCISVIYRALNEEKWFYDSLVALKNQKIDYEIEIVLVDSGSTDKTLEIAEEFDCNITHIKKENFSFGRSLNQGCSTANGDILVFISAHCIPFDDHWLINLVAPIINNEAEYVYGRQIGHEVSNFSEKQIFAKYYPEKSSIPQEGFFCNNANSALARDIWEKYRFDEDVTGLEDMVLAKQIYNDGKRIAYVADAIVIHIHEESFRQVQNRFFREALTMRDIMPEIQISGFDFVRYLTAGVLLDSSIALEQKQFWKQIVPIIRYRFRQYWGTYRGHHENKKISSKQKESYYFPKTKAN